MSVYILRRRKLGRTSCREISAMSETDIKVVRNDQQVPADATMVIRWGTTSNVPCRNILNTAEAIHRIGDKAGFRRVMMESQQGNGGVLLCPRTFFADTINQWVPEQQGPLIVRPKVHAQGRHVYKVNNQQELQQAIARCGVGWYAAHFINKVAEYRVFFAQGRAVWVAKKTPGNPQDVAWNVARGGRFDNVRFDEWPLKAIRISREAFNLSGLHFGGVDVMVDADGNAFVLEINSAPSQTSPYRQGCVAKAFDYIIRNGKDPIPVTEARGGWKKFIHPAISNEAILVQ